MNRDGASKIWAILLVFVVVVIAVTGIIWAGKAIFSGNNSNGQSIETSNPGEDALTNVTAESGVRITVRKPITAEETHRSYQITVRPNSRNMTTYEGYVGTVLKSENLPNNTNAYTELSFALNRGGMAKNRKLGDAANDIRGICAGGTLYQFDVLRGNDVVQQTWATTCDSIKGSLDARAVPLLQLFLNQIPDSRKLLSASHI